VKAHGLIQADVGLGLSDRSSWLREGDERSLRIALSRGEIAISTSDDAQMRSKLLASVMSHAGSHPLGKSKVPSR